MLDKRSSILTRHRDRLYSEASLSLGGGVTLPLSKFGAVPSSSLSGAPATWRASSACLTVKALAKFQDRSLPDVRSRWMPWKELEQVLRELPTKLE